MKKILLVDNEQPVLHSLSKTLQDSLLEVKTAASGSEAIEKISACLYDLCFIDLHLSDMKSINVIRQIRELSPRTRIIAMSASYIESHIKEEVETSVYLFISKPAAPEQIKAIIMLVLQEDKDTPPDADMYGNKLLKEKRMFKRKEFEKTISCRVTYSDLFEIKCFVLEARIFDVCYGGLGMHTSHLLPPGCEVSFSDNVITDHVGVVMNSTLIDQDLYRVGIAFA